VTGQHHTRISRIENGAQAPAERNILDWCAASGSLDQAAYLIATAQTVESAYLKWARQSRAGMRRLGDAHSIATYQHTTTFVDRAFSIRVFLNLVEPRAGRERNRLDRLLSM